MTWTATGRLRHCWFGEYCAVIGLRFTSELAAEGALGVLGEPWERIDTSLRFSGSGQALKSAEAQLRRYGADMAKVSSLRYSIDYGEPFTVTVSTPIPDDGLRQGSLLEAR